MPVTKKFYCFPTKAEKAAIRQYLALLLDSKIGVVEEADEYLKSEEAAISA